MSPLLHLGHRMSSLPVTEFCGQAGVLSQMGSFRYAAMSSAFHALVAKSPNATDLMLRLTADEMAEISRWKRPPDVDVGQGRILRYADAEKEIAVAIDGSGSYVDPQSPRAVSVGHFDFGWVVEGVGFKLAYVGDIKRSEFTVEEGCESLQLHGYGLAYATKHDCDGYVVGIWAAVEGLWQWSAVIDLEGREALTYAKRVVGAARNTSPDYAMGPHCRKCYGRMRCPAWLLPPEAAKTSLAPLALGSAGLTHDNAGELLLAVQRAEDTCTAAKANLREWAARNGGIRDAKSGKVWLPVLSRGRESVSVEAVRAEFGADAEKVISTGKAYETFRWTNGRRT